MGTVLQQSDAPQSCTVMHHGDAPQSSNTVLHHSLEIRSQPVLFQKEEKMKIGVALYRLKSGLNEGLK